MTGAPPPGTTSRRQDALGLATFVALGLPDGMLGTAWPSMRHSLHAAVGDLGLVLIAYTVGAVAVTAVVGRLVHRRGVELLLASSCVVAVVAAGLVATAPALAAVIAGGLAFGLAGGAMDSGLNSAVGGAGRGRLLNLLHGFYGVGTMIGPLLVTAAVVTSSWRAGYFALVGVDVVLAGLWVAGRRTERAATPPAATPPAATPPTEAAPPTHHTQPLPRRAVAAGLAVFFLYTGLEVSAGQWETTFARDRLHFSVAAAGVATFGYWGALTAVRLGLGALRRPPALDNVLRTGTALALAAGALIWWQPAPAATVIGFVVMGGALAGVFPALVALTPARVGPGAAGRVIAWQVGAAPAGGAALSAAVGLLIQDTGIGVVGPALTVMAVVLVGGEAVLRRMTPAGTHVR